MLSRACKEFRKKACILGKRKPLINFEERSNEDPKLIGRRLLQRADKALYQAKQGGRDQVVFLDKD